MGHWLRTVTFVEVKVRAHEVEVVPFLLLRPIVADPIAHEAAERVAVQAIAINTVDSLTPKSSAWLVSFGGVCGDEEKEGYEKKGNTHRT